MNYFPGVVLRHLEHVLQRNLLKQVLSPNVQASGTVLPLFCVGVPFICSTCIGHQLKGTNHPKNLKLKKTHRSTSEVVFNSSPKAADSYNVILVLAHTLSGVVVMHKRTYISVKKKAEHV